MVKPSNMKAEDHNRNHKSKSPVRKPSIVRQLSTPKSTSRGPSPRSTRTAEQQLASSTQQHAVAVRDDNGSPPIHLIGQPRLDVISGSPSTGIRESSDQTLERIMKEQQGENGSPPIPLPIRNQEQVTDRSGGRGSPPTAEAGSAVTPRLSGQDVSHVESESIVNTERGTTSVHAREESNDSMLKKVEDKLKDSRSGQSKRKMKTMKTSRHMKLLTR